MTDTGGAEQLELIAPPRTVAAKAKPARQSAPLATERPIARVAVDMPLPHLDRLFDYAVPLTLDAAAQPGCRVKVRFAGKLVGGYLIERVEHSDHTGTLAPLAKIVSSEPVLRPDVLAAARSVADRYAGTLADVLRLAIPPRHARTEAKPPTAPADAAGSEAQADRARSDQDGIGTNDDAWGSYESGSSFLAAVAAGESPRACWAALPGASALAAIAQLAAATLANGRGIIVCVPDATDAERLDREFRAVLGDSRHVILHASQGPAERYRSFLALSRGTVKAVIGTRAAAFAPVHDLGMTVIWDDGDDLHAELRAPYPHAREVLLTRALAVDAGVLIAGHARTAEAQQLVDSGWCRELSATQPVRRAGWPRIEITDGSVAGGAPARLPRAVFTAIRTATGPVLIQVPRRGYRAALACQQCRARAECPHCHGPLAQHSADAAPVCRWCSTRVERWECPYCQGRQLRAPVVGTLRTAEEIAQAFPDHQVITSGGATIKSTVPAERSIVLATPGAEPWADGGYSVVVLLDTWLMLGRPELRVVEEAHRRWFNALALAAPGGKGIIVGDAAPLQALVRADPVGFARRELAARNETHMPPAARIGTLEADPELIAMLSARPWPAEVLGPVPLPSRGDEPARERLILRTPRGQGRVLAAALKELQAERSAAKAAIPRVQIDPLTV